MTEATPDPKPPMFDPKAYATLHEHKQVYADYQEHTSANEMLVAALDQCLQDGTPVGSRDGATTEVLDKTHVLLNPLANVVTIPERKMKPEYMGMELLWYLAGQDKTEVPEHYARTYRRFAQCPDRGDVMSGDEPYCWGAYGARLYGYFHYLHSSEFREACTMRSEGNGQLEIAADILREKTLSRQAVVQLWSPKDLVHSKHGGVNDVPCTIAFQFLVRKGCLRMTVFMRSSDAWLGLPNDIFALTSMQKLIAASLGLPTGPATFHMTSLHVYDRDKAKAEALLRTYGTLDGAAVEQSLSAYDYSSHPGGFIGQAEDYFKRLAQTVRFTRHGNVRVSFDFNKGGFLEDCFAAAVTKLVSGEEERRGIIDGINTPGLRRLFEAGTYAGDGKGSAAC